MYFRWWQTFGNPFRPEIEVFQKTADQQRLIGKAEDLHLATAIRAFQRVDAPDLLDAFPPGPGGIFFCEGSVMVRTSVASDVIVDLSFARFFLRSPLERLERQP